MSQSTYIVTTKLKAKPGCENELQDSLQNLISPTLKEKGCICYTLHRSQDNSSEFLFFETWSSLESFQAHLDSAHVQDWLKNKSTLLSEPLELINWQNIVN